MAEAHGYEMDPVEFGNNGPGIEKLKVNAKLALQFLFHPDKCDLKVEGDGK